MNQETEEREEEFHPFKLLAVIAGVTATLAVICYGLQVYYLVGPEKHEDKGQM